MWISLVGFNASGKSTLARQLGQLSGRTVCDLDAAVVRHAGRPLPELFATGGPDLVRDLEVRVLRDLPPDAPLVIATGGGTVEHPEARALLGSRSLVVWLDADWPHLRRRLAPVPPAGPSPVWQHLGEDGFAALYRRRRPLFAAVARLRLDATTAPASLARRLLGRCWQLLPPVADGER
jgi:shikimate kinase